MMPRSALLAKKPTDRNELKRPPWIFEYRLQWIDRAEAGRIDEDDDDTAFQFGVIHGREPDR